MNINNLLSIVPLLCFSFLGFDAVTTLAEETKNPKKNTSESYLCYDIDWRVIICCSYLFCTIDFPRISMLLRTLIQL
ncbi:hypothetical protein RCO48_17395 [Peribacillus frigoritolerans]|nr:hypothetical protein [Peribacillus frigoritolerans]